MAAAAVVGAPLLMHPAEVLLAGPVEALRAPVEVAERPAVRQPAAGLPVVEQRAEQLDSKVRSR